MIVIEFIKVIRPLMHYYDENKILLQIVFYSFKYISRTPDNDNIVKRLYRPMSIVVDCYN